MNSLLYEIYSGDYDTTLKQDKKQQELGKKICVEWDKIKDMFGDEFVERLFALEAEREEWREFHCYRMGFCTGVRLMLEAIISATG